jgi:AcrR family transcriptional regulator
MPRRTQAERSDATTTELVAAGQRLFGRDGYAATSIDAVAAAAGVTKGAAYHHFDGKAGLFRAVFTREQERAAAALEAAAGAAPDPWSALRSGCRTWLEQCLDPAFRRIVLLDGPAVLGWQAVRDIQLDHTARVLTDGLREATGTSGDLTTRARLVLGVLCEAGMLLARAGDPPAALPTIAAEADRLLTALARPA